MAVDGPDDPRVAGYANLLDGSKRRDADRLEGAFILEGTRVIRQALDDGWPLESLLLSTSRCEARPDLVGDGRAAGAEVYCAGPDLFDRIAGYHAHRGALARARRPPLRGVEEVVAAAVGAGRRLVLVVEGVNDHENLGSLFRNAAAFSAGAVVLDPATADPLYRRAVRVSVGHVLRVPFARAVDWPGDLGALRSAGLTVAALTPGGDVTVDDLAVDDLAVDELAVDHLAGPNGPGSGGWPATASGADRSASGMARLGPPSAGGRGWAVMVGSEGDGLSAAALEAADLRVRIPIAAGVDSINVATAAAIALHRLGGARHATA